MVDIKLLYELQLVDTRIGELESALVDVRAKLADNSEVVTAGERLRRLEVQFEKVSGERRSVQASVDQLTEKVESVERTLYGGTISNPRELGAYEVERDMVQRQRSGEEDKLLEFMVQFEDLQGNANNARTLLERLESERTEHIKEWSAEERRLVSDLEFQNGIRSEMTPGIPPAALVTYDSLLKSRDGFAVARVERGACQGCRISLPTSVEQQARTSEAIVQCSSCYRILFVD